MLVKLLNDCHAEKVFFHASKSVFSVEKAHAKPQKTVRHAPKFFV